MESTEITHIDAMTCLAEELWQITVGDKASDSYLPQLEAAHYSSSVSECVSISRVVHSAGH